MGKCRGRPLYISALAIKVRPNWMKNDDDGDDNNNNNNNNSNNN